MKVYSGFPWYLLNAHKSAPPFFRKTSTHPPESSYTQQPYPPHRQKGAPHRYRSSSSLRVLQPWPCPPGWMNEFSPRKLRPWFHWWEKNHSTPWCLLNTPLNVANPLLGSFRIGNAWISMNLLMNAHHDTHQPRFLRICIFASHQVSWDIRFSTSGWIRIPFGSDLSPAQKLPGVPFLKLRSHWKKRPLILFWQQEWPSGLLPQFFVGWFLSGAVFLGTIPHQRLWYLLLSPFTYSWCLHWKI